MTEDKHIKKQPRFRVDQREGRSHGDLYELEQDFFFDVIDTATEKAVMTFEGHNSGSYSSESPTGWRETNYTGVRTVEISKDGRFALVYEGDDKEPKKVELPDIWADPTSSA